MKALLRPVFVGAISIAIAATSLVGSASVALAVPPPLVTSWSLDLPVYEGADVFLNGTFTGGAGTGPYTLDVYWFGEASGIPSESYSFATLDHCALPDVCWTVRVQKAVPYANDQPNPITVVVYLSDPSRTNRANLPAFTISNTPPSFKSFGLSATDLDAGGSVTATGTFTDGGANDTHTVKLAWGDDSPVTTLNLDPGVYVFTTDPHTYAATGEYIVSAIVTDDAGAWSPATSTLSVHEPAQPNQAPSVVSFDVTAGPEGGSTSLALTFADADTADTHTVSVVWGDSSSDPAVVLAAGETTFSATHVYADTGTFPLALTLTDSATPAHSVTQTRSVSPANVRPAVGALTLTPSAVVDHQELTLTGSFKDPGTADTFTLTVTWGDGKSSELGLGTVQSFSVNHVYDSAGSFTIRVTVTDADGGNDSATANLVVGSSNHAPTDLAFAVTATGANVVVTGSFTDPDTTDTHTVALSWGDGVIQEVAADGTTFTAPHTYAASNTYTVTATVTDHPAGTSTLPLSKTVVVTILASSAADVLDEMSDLVRSFDLDRNTERWLLKKIDDLKASLAYGNGQVCSATGTLDHILAFADRTIGNDHFAEFRALTAKLEAAAGCSSNGAQSPKVQKAATVTAKTVTPTTASPTTSAPTPKKDTTAKSAKADTKATAGRNAH